MLRKLMTPLLAASALAVVATPAYAGKEDRARAAIAAAEAKVHTAETMGAGTAVPEETARARAALSMARENFKADHNEEAITNAIRATSLAEAAIGHLQQANQAAAAQQQASADAANQQAAAAQQEAAAANARADDASARAAMAERSAAASAAEAQSARAALASQQEVQTTVTTQQPVFAWSASVDPEGQVVTYELELSDGGQVIALVEGIGGTATVLAQLLEEGHPYSWRVRATGGVFSAARDFTVVLPRQPDAGTMPTGGGEGTGGGGGASMPTGCSATPVAHVPLAMFGVLVGLLRRRRPTE